MLFVMISKKLKKYTKNKVYGAEIKSGHFIPEQNPKETIKHLKNFFNKYV